MFKIDEGDLKKIVELSNNVPTEYRQKCFEVLLTYYVQTLSVHSKSTFGDKNTTKQIKEEKEFIIPIEVKAFLSQYGLDISILNEFFLIEGSEVQPIYKLTGKAKRKNQINNALLMTLETAIHSGQFQVSIEDLRTRCGDQQCYDDTNFFTNLKSFAKWFKTIDKEQPLILSQEGKSELANLLDQLMK